MSTDVAKMPHSGLGSDMFNSALPSDSGGTITSQASVPDESIGSDDDDDDSASTSSAASAIIGLASVTLVDSVWQSAPSYPPQYLSTANEYIPPPNKTHDPTAGTIDDNGVQEGHGWGSEKYENSMHTDHVFDRFNERTAHEPQQCVRCAPLLLRIN